MDSKSQTDCMIKEKSITESIRMGASSAGIYIYNETEKSFDFEWVVWVLFIATMMKTQDFINDDHLL